MKTIFLLLLLTMPTPALSAEAVTAARLQAADGTYTLVHHTVVDAPVAAVWAAASTAEGWSTWAAPRAWTPPGAPNLIETSFSPGARPGDATTIQQQIVVQIAEVLMVFRTTNAPEGFPDFST